MRLLLRAGRREMRRHAAQTLLAVLGVALGVAVVVAVALANESARRAFALSMEEVTGRATHQILGGPQGLEEGLYRTLRLAGVRDIAPVVEGVVEVQGEPLELLGIDPLAERGIRGQAADLDGTALRRFLVEPGAVAISRMTAGRLGLAPGQRFALRAGGVDREAVLVGLLRPGQGRSAGLDGLVVADIATAQELLGRIGRLDRIDLLDPDGSGLQRIRPLLPPDARVVDAEGRTEESLSLTRAFHTNLTAMSLLALVVGAFLIYNTATTSVLRRRLLIGSLRVIGATRRQVFVLVLLEAALVGLAGSLLGLGAGHLLGGGLVRLVARTINDLYFVLTVTELIPTVGPYLAGMLLGVGVSIGAAVAPALEAARISPLEARRRSSATASGDRRPAHRAVIGTLVLLVGMMLLYPPGLIAGFAALFLVLLGGSLFAPAVLTGVGRAAVAPLHRLGAVGLQAARGTAGGLSRGGVAVAALAVAVSATVGVGVMVESFRQTVDAWLSERLPADFYLSAAGGSRQADAPLLPETAERVARIGGVAALRLTRRVEVAGPGGPVHLLAVELPPGRSHGFRLTAGEPAEAWPAFDAGAAVLVSEPLARREGLKPGSRLTLQTAQGPRTFTVAGAFVEYGSDRGVVALHRGLYRRWWGDDAVSAIGVYLAPGAAPGTVVEEIRRAIADLPQRPRIRETGEIRRESLAVFDRTFIITRVLRLLAVGVAFVGVLSALMALQLSRAKEHAVLRATGFTPGQLFGVIGLQTGLVGLAAGVLALPMGLFMAGVLIEVINRRAFGWSMEAIIPPGTLWGALLLALTASLLAGLYPAWRIARTPPALALREE